MSIPASWRTYPIYRGWYLVAFAFTAQMVAGPYVTGVIFRPMTEDLHWSRGDFALANTFSVIVGGSIGLFVGPLVDGRHGRWLLTVGALIAGLSLSSLAFVHELWQFWLLRGVLYMVGSASISPMVVNAILSKWFVRKRGRAISIASMGLSAGAVVLAPAIAYVIVQFGWRVAWAVQGGLLCAALAVPAMLIIRRQPEDVGLLPDGASEPINSRLEPARTAVTEESWTRREAMRTRELWMLIAIFGIGGLPASAIVLHLIPFFQDVGFSVAVAVFIVGFENAFALVSKPIWGYYLDQLDPRRLVALGWGFKLLPLLGLPLIGNTYGLWPVLPLAALYGIGVGSGQTGQEVIWAHYFGRRHIGAVRSIASPFTIIFGAGGTWFAGVAWDATGSYTLPFILFAVLSLVAMIGIMLVRPPTHPTDATVG